MQDVLFFLLLKGLCDRRGKPEVRRDPAYTLIEPTYRLENHVWIETAFVKANPKWNPKAYNKTYPNRPYLPWALLERDPVLGVGPGARTAWEILLLREFHFSEVYCDFLVLAIQLDFPVFNVLQLFVLYWLKHMVLPILPVSCNLLAVFGISCKWVFEVVSAYHKANSTPDHIAP